MKSLMIIAADGVVSMGLWSVLGQESPGIDPMISSSIKAPAAGRNYTISNVVAATACLAERGSKISVRSEQFVAGADCDAVWPGLSTDRTWTNNGDGTAVVKSSFIKSQIDRHRQPDEDPHTHLQQKTPPTGYRLLKHPRSLLLELNKVAAG